ncbi:MAG: formate dehydrogenase accessory sulfurtransferase FdhD, partial [Acidobacteriota bacterium]|nr:formate dehydrogenase accessory sulfurtransferase FdhD [Acidobacteriota bacterium]
MGEDGGFYAAAEVDRIERGVRASGTDHVAVEEPLEIRLDGKSIAVVMRSPGHDEELAAGFLYTEALIRTADELDSVTHRRDPKNPDLANVVDAKTTGGVDIDARGWQRNFVSASSCGLCGKLTIESVRLQVPSVRDDDLSISTLRLQALPDKMRAGQSGFDETGGVHAAALFDPEGNLVTLREDIGRHNAVDKVIGAALLADQLPLRGHVLMVSGRASFELETTTFVVEMRSVNHRFVDVHLRLPRFLSALETGLRARVKQRFGRGKFDVTVNASAPDGLPTRVEVDLDAAAQYLGAAELLRRQRVPGELDVATLLALPGVSQVVDADF